MPNQDSFAEETWPLTLGLGWLPELPSWKDLLQDARRQAPETAFAAFQKLANTRMDFIRAGQLDKAIQRYLADHPASSPFASVRLALLGSGTLSHLLPGIRLAALRRGLLVDIYTGPYGMYRQELTDPASALFAFRPEVVCFSFDAEHLAPAGGSPEDTLANLEFCWRTAGDALGAAVVQQTALPRFPLLMGSNEDRFPQSRATVLRVVNERIRAASAAHGVSLLSVDTWSAVDGVASWFPHGLWYSAKQEVHPRAAMFYGELLGRLLGAMRGRSGKCLVLDLDNTLWGGVIGDDGLDGIALGQGSPAGEAFLAMQRYARQLAERGVILAVCSKNDYSNAIAPFERHPEMVLRPADIACFVANWQDKAANLRVIAETLNIGLDSLVFVDDNPAERRLIRTELPMVAVPELPEDPAGYVATLSAAGYFEALHLTAEDTSRTLLYRANRSREALRASSTDLGSYLQGLAMQLHWSPFDSSGLKRITQLINKTNQFNLTTRRYTEAETGSILRGPEALTLQLRLTDVHGDNGMIGVIIAYPRPDHGLLIDTWLMSCRVLGRGVEQAALNILAEQARVRGYTVLHGLYRPSPKNGMVREHYKALGFDLVRTLEDGATEWVLPLDRFTGLPAPMEILKGDACHPAMSMSS